MKVIGVETTPNPDAIKFNVDTPLLAAGARHFENAEAASGNALATALFAIPQVRSVFFMPTFVTVSKQSEARWDDLTTPITGAIEATGATGATGEAAAESDDGLFRQIEEIFDTRVRPALAADGGGIELIDVEDHTVVVRYQGACGSCPSAISGTLRAIEHLLRVDVDPAISVIAG